MTELASLIISGLVGGGLAAMIAIGLVTTYSTTGIFNIAQGSVAFLSAYSFLELTEAAHLPKVVSALITVLCVAPALGLALEAWVFRRLSRAPEMARNVGTVGLALAIPAFVILALQYLADIPALSSVIVTPDRANPIPLGPEPTKAWDIGLGIVVTSDQVIVLGLTVVTGFLYWYLLRRTRLGLEMRAVVDGHGLATIRGISEARVSRLSWVLSFSSAALVGICASVSLGLGPNTYLELLFVAAAAAVLGGLKSVPGAFAGALGLGVAQNLVTGYLQRGPFAQVNGLGSAVPFVALLLGLFVMGRRKQRVAGTQSSAGDAPVRLTLPRRTVPQRLQTCIVVGVTAVVIVMVAGAYWDQFIAEGLCMSIIFLSFVVVTGQLGTVSLAQASLVTCGGMLAGWLAGVYGLPLWAAAMLAVLTAVVAGVIAAIPAVRLGGLSLALATLALAFILDDLVFEVPSVQGPGGGGWGIARPSFAGGNSSYSLILLGILMLLVLLVRNFQLSATGRSVLAVRGSRVGAAASGISVQKAVVVAFGLSALIAGVGGFLYAQTFSQITSTSNPPLNALLWVTIVVTIGIRRPMGAVLAGMSSAILPQLLTYVTTSTEWPLLFWGVGAVVLAEFPEGTLDLHIRQLVHLRDQFVPASLIRRGLAFYRLSPASAEPDPASSRVVAAAPGQAIGHLRQPPGAIYGVNTAAELRTCPGDIVNGAAAAMAGDLPAPGAHAYERDVTDGKQALATRRLRSGYGDLEVLHGVDLAVRTGQITGVFGANGSGKSTLCSTLAGLIRPTAGEIELEGQPIGTLSGTERARRGLFVVTESRSIFPSLTVEENLRIALRTPEAMGEALDQFALLKTRRRTRAGMLSGGEQQLLALAPALITKPRVLVADEPTLGLAPRASEQVLHVFEQLRDTGTAVLLIEERPRGVFAVCDQVALLHLGHLLWQRRRRDVSVGDLLESYLAGVKR